MLEKVFPTAVLTLQAISGIIYISQGKVNLGGFYVFCSIALVFLTYAKSG